MGTEEAKYEVVRAEDNIEIRKYDPQLVAETIIESDLEGAGNKAFRLLFDYISGNNSSTNKIAMTAPVSQEAAGSKIAMTSPVSVSQQNTNNQFAVSFMMPASYTMKTIPTPKNSAVKIREIPERHVAAIRYSGRWTEKRYLKFKKELEAWMQKEGIEAIGKPVWARYNPPFTLWFLRRNEVLIPIKDPKE